jgi:hypothetical protein
MTPSKLHELAVPISRIAWGEALQTGAPDTPSDYDAWNIGNLLPHMDTGHKIAKMTLAAFDESQTTEAVLRWGTDKGLVPAHPTIALAVGAEKPLLIDEVGRKSLGIAPLVPFVFEGAEYVCTLWWYPRRKKDGRVLDPERIAFLTRYDLESRWSKDYYFAFVS